MRRGELLFTEEPLFLSSTAECLKMQEELFQRPSTALPLATQLFVAVLHELIQRGQTAKIEQLKQLEGHQQQWASTARTLYDALKEEVAQSISFERFLELFAQCAANAHEVDGAQGAAIFVLGSMAEHSCRPNAFKNVQGSQLTVRAMEDLVLGEKVSISYIPEYYPTWQRQRLLLHGFNFHCRCERCCGFETPELCCAFRCPECEGPCCPSTPCTELGGFCELLCEECGLRCSGEQLEAFKKAETLEEFGEESAAALHPYHFKIFHMYLKHLDQVPAATALQIFPQLFEAFGRLREEGHPFLSQLAQRAAACCGAWKCGGAIRAGCRIAHGARHRKGSAACRGPLSVRGGTEPRRGHVQFGRAPCAGAGC